MRLVFIHGIAQGGRNPKDIETEWLSALNEGLSRSGSSLPRGVEVKVPFYGDALDKLVREYEVPLDQDIITKGGDIPDDFAAFRAAVVEAMRLKAGISDEEAQAEMGIDVADKGVQNWRWVLAIVRILDRRVPKISGWTIEEFLREVYVYSQKSAARKKVDQIVQRDITDDTAVIVGHSLGSVVGYNLLCVRSSTNPVGSPLAIRPIRKKLGILKNPAGQKGWYNAFDPADIVSLCPLDSKNFNVAPPITNDSQIANWTDNHHGIVGYLDDAKVAKVIRSGFQKNGARSR